MARMGLKNLFETLAPPPGLTGYPITFSAHEANSVCGLIPIIIPRNSSVTSLMLWPHSNMATYCDRHHLLTPRNGRRKFLSPVHVPSIVLQCTSRTPSPSASIAYLLFEPEWSTVTWTRS